MDDIEERNIDKKRESRLILFFRQRPGLTAALLLLFLAILFLGQVLLPAEGEVMGGHDMRGYYYPYYDQVREAVRGGHLPFWEPTLFNGFPLMAQPQQNAFYPPLWPSFLISVNVGISLYILLHIWLAGLGMYAFVRYMGGRWLPAMLAALVFAFSGLLAGRLWAGHSTVYALDAWMPWVLLGLVWSVRRGSWWTAVIAGLPLGMALLAGHIPSFLYMAMIWGAFVIYLLLTERGKRWLVIRQTTVMLVVGLALSAVQLAPFLQFSLASERLAEADYQFATEYSLPPAHLITLAVPEFFGEPIRTGYWSVPTFEELTYYAGMLVFLGIVLALRKPTRLSWFFIILMVFGLALALGRYGVLYPLAYKYLPPFRLVRAPGRATFLFLFAAAALLGHSFSNWQELPVPDRLSKLGPTWRWTLALSAVLGIAALAATGALFMAVHPTDTSGRLWHQIGGYSVAVIVLLLGGGLLWAYLATSEENGRRKTLIGAALILLVVTDMWLFSLKFVRLEPVTPDALWVDAREVIGETKERVLPWGVSLFEHNGPMQVGLNSVFGYDSLEPANHIALTSSVPDPRSSAYDVLAARYVIASTELDQFGDGERPLTLLEQNGAAWVYERARPMPVARLVYTAEVIPDDDAAIARIHQPDFDPETTAILASELLCNVGPTMGEGGTAEIIAAKAGHWQIRTESQTPALLLLAETDYPGWRVSIDDQPAVGLRAYTTLRAVCVPEGVHDVTWTYVPTVYVAGGLISLMALVLIGLALFRWRRAEASSETT
jgi:hypothetical protein